MRFKFIVASLCVLCASASSAQEQGWTLNECIEFAQKNNVTVRQRVLQSENREVELNTTKNSRLPNLNASLGANMYFGRGPSRDGTYTDNNQLSGSGSASAAIAVFQGMRIKNQIKGGELNLAAAIQDLERAREDVALNVTSFYLNVLYYKEMIKVAQQQLAFSQEQAQRSRVLFESGKNSQSAVFESDALVARDEASLTQQRNNLSLALLDLSQALNRESADGFNVRDPKLDSMTLNSMSTLPSANNTYDYAVNNRPSIKAEDLRLRSSEYEVKVAKSALYPSISMNGGYGNNVYRSFMSGANNQNFWQQLSRNGNEYIGMSINIPIFNRLATRNQIRTANIGVRSQQLSLAEAELNLRKEIEKSYYSASAAYAQYLSSEKAYSSALVAFEFEREKSAVGRSTIFDFNDAKTRMEKAESELVQAKYEFVFRRKILDFYAGKPLEFSHY